MSKMKVRCNKCHRDFDPSNLDEVMFHEVHAPIIATRIVGKPKSELPEFFYDCRWALLGFACSSVLNCFAVNVRMGVATLCAGTAVVLTIRLVLHPWIRHVQRDIDQGKRDLAAAIERKNELARELGWPTS